MSGRIARLLFPPKCASCGELLDWYTSNGETALCPSCRRLWDSEKLETCTRCAKQVTKCTCVPEALEKASCAGFYKLVYYRHGKREPVQNRAIYRIKQTRDRKTVNFLAEECLGALRAILAAVRAAGGDPSSVFLTYVPRGRRARLEYGTDQAQALAKALSARSGIPCLRLLKKRAGKKREQKQLNRAERLRNTQNAYATVGSPALKNMYLILVDDIVTTGITAAACVRLLRRAGARKVWCLAVASDDVNQSTK